MSTALKGVRGQRHALAALYPGKDPVPIVQEAGWVQGPFWTGAENLGPTGVQPVTSRYTDYATRPTKDRNHIYNSYGYKWSTN